MSSWKDDDHSETGLSKDSAALGNIDPIGLLKLFVERSKQSMGEWKTEGKKILVGNS